MMRCTTRFVLVCLAASAVGASNHATGPDDVADPLLGTTIMLRQDGSIVRLSESVALSVPWTGTASGVSIGNERGCALAWPLALAPRAIGQALWLADGQCLLGACDLVEATKPGTIRWRSSSPLMTIPLSAVRAWTAAGVDVPTDTIDADRITLRNDDTVDGLVTDLGSTVTIDVDGVKRTIDVELIASIQFVQAADAPATRDRLRVWVDDGSIIDAESIEREGTLLRLSVPVPAGEKMSTLRLRIDQVLGLATPALSRDGLVLRNLGVSPASTTGSPPPGSPAWSSLPGIIPSVELTGPGRLGWMQAVLRGPGSWSLPIVTDGVLVSRVLVPDRARPVADHALVVRQAGVELARIEARSETRSMRVAVKPGTVELDLVPGKPGPVGCVMELADLVFIRAAP
ncbi:MAG: hypothetical protein FJ270_01740 [Planctomycetes bacterium]|nr:hypothetical protein [Planctomycetota bacterium]